jgi:hypothetical protein
VNEEQPLAFALYQNYPNPSNPTTKIRFQITDYGPVTLKVVDVLGKEAATVVNKDLQRDFYEIEFEARELAGGVYFYTLKAEGKVATRKFVLLR